MRTYRTAEVAEWVGVHPNTVRLYEEWGLIPRPERDRNRYRVYTQAHLAQLRLVRLALQVEVMQRGLRKMILEVVKTSAAGAYDRAMALTDGYLLRVRRERQNAEEAIEIVRRLWNGGPAQGGLKLKRKEASAYLDVSMDTLRNWEMNGLLTVKRRENGYRVYTDEDIRRLKIIRALRCANYSLEAILRLLAALSADPNADIRTALNTPRADEDIISVCDALILSLQAAERNALQMKEKLRNMEKGIYSF